MASDGGVSIDLTCDCGHKFQIPIAGKDLETLETTCPACGDVSTFDEGQIAGIMATYGQARKELLDHASKSVSDMLAKTARGLKGVTYRPKR